ncbi:MAG: hypothetical protein ACT4PV_14510 [Planctomycetaceae bacterium]
MPQVLGILLIVLLVGSAIWIGVLVERKRREACLAFARALGFRFHPKDPFGLARRLEGAFATLREGSNRYAYNVIEGEREGARVCLFDHHHETYSTDSKGHRTTHHHHRSFVSVEQALDLGAFEMRPEGFFDRVAAAFGFDDIDFESAEFSRRYHVKAPDRKLAYALFNPRMIEYLLSVPPLRLAAAGKTMLGSRGSGKMDRAEFEPTLRDLFAFLERVPRYVHKDRDNGEG